MCFYILIDCCWWRQCFSCLLLLLCVFLLNYFVIKCNCHTYTHVFIIICLFIMGWRCRIRCSATTTRITTMATTTTSAAIIVKVWRWECTIMYRTSCCCSPQCAHITGINFISISRFSIIRFMIFYLLYGMHDRNIEQWK